MMSDYHQTRRKQADSFRKTEFAASARTVRHALFAICVFASSSLLAGAAGAQSLVPEDAFGDRAGVEQTGLYSEAAARGFDLSNTNVYRIEESYFVRTAPLPDPVIARVRVKAGIAAARATLPSPSGVIEYSLKKPSANALTIVSGIRDYGSQFAELSASAVAQEGDLGVVAGALLLPSVQYADGTKGQLFQYGVTAYAQALQSTRLTVFGSLTDQSFGGRFGFVPTGDTLPAVLPVEGSLSPDWARFSARTWNAGAISNTSLSEALNLRLAAFYSRFEPQTSDFTLIQLDSPDTARAMLFRTPSRLVEGKAVEARLQRRFGTGPTTHSFSAAVRARWSDAIIARSTAVDLGEIDPKMPVYPSEPVAAPSSSVLDDSVSQTTFTAAYTMQMGQALEVRVGTSLTGSRKHVASETGTVSEVERHYILPYGSVIWSPSQALSLFASYVSGLEDTAIAPQSAVNADAILAPVLARQFEVGARAQPLPELSVSLAFFNVTKPSAGIGPDRIYAFIGNANHRGIEASAIGRLGATTSLVAGLAVMGAEVGGPNGATTPPGVSQELGFARIEQRIPWAQGLSLDAQLSFQGPRYLDVANRFRTDGLTTANVGLRHQLKIAGTPAELRATLSNVFDRLQWVASAGGLLLRNPPRSFRAFLTVRL